MAVLGRLLLGSAERLDLPDLLALDSHTAADFKYLIQTFIGGDTPLVLKGFDIIQPQDSIGTENVSIRVADSVVYYPGSKAGSFYYGLPEGNTTSQPLVPELRKNATNFVYLTFNTFDTAKDSRAFWDPDQNGGAGGEFSQDVNTESVLSMEVNVSVSTFPDNTIPIAKITVGSSVIESIQDCRDLMFRLGGGGVTPNPFSSYNFRPLPSVSYERSEPPTLMTSALDPNPFQGGDKNILTLKEWMDAVMTKLKEISGTTYWYESTGGGGGGGGSPITITNVYNDALAATLKSKGQWQHSGTVAGQATWTEDIHYISLRDPRDLIIRASTIQLANEQVAWIRIVRDANINNSTTSVAWVNGLTIVNGITGSFVNLAKGDWTKKKADTSDKYLRVEEFYALPNLAGGTTTPTLAQSIRLSANYAGTTGSEIGEYTKGEYLVTDVNITNRDAASVQLAGGNLYWIAYRSDTELSLAAITPTQLTVSITEADSERARVTSTVAHGLSDGDYVTITTGPYAATYKVDVVDTTNFFIQTTVTGDSTSQTAFYAVVTTASRSTPYSYQLESADHGFQSGEHIKIQNTSTLYDGSYLINVRTPQSFNIAISSLIADPGAIQGEIVVLPRMNVRTEFGTVKIVQGETADIGDQTQNLLDYIGMQSLAQTAPDYIVPAGANMLHGYQNYNSSPLDNLTIRAARLTAMMADRVQDRGMQIVGRTNITSVTSGANQLISALGNLTLVRPSSPDQAITMTTPISLPANSAIVIDLDRDNNSTITPVVVSLGNNLLLQENRIMLFYRFGTTKVYDWRGNGLAPYGHINTEQPEDSQNKNITIFNPGQVKLNSTSGLVTLDVKRVPEQTRVTTIAAASVPQSSYFTFASANDTTKYYVWYSKDGGGINPAIAGRTGIQVNITTGQTATTVAASTRAAMNTIAGADVTATDNLGVVTWLNTTNGPSTDAANGVTSTTFTIVILQQGFAPDISVLIPGSATNTIKVDTINGLGTLVLGDGQSAWIRVNRFAAKTFNTIATVDGTDTDANGKIYITNTTATPIDQDVVVLWTRVGDNLLVTHQAEHPDGNIYDEALSVVSGTPLNSYQIQGPITSGTVLQLPPDSRDTGSVQEYIVGSGQLEVFLNGQYLQGGVDWLEVGTAGALSSRIQIQQSIAIGDLIQFRVDSTGAVYFAAGSGGGGSLQSGYDAGRFIATIAGQPIVITGPSGKLISIQGDMEVTGVIDPSGLTFSQQASDPLQSTDFGLWRNISDELIYKRGIGVAINLVTDFVRRDGTSAATANQNLGGFQIKNLANPTLAQDAATKTYVDALGTTIGSGFLKLDGTNPMAADLNLGTHKLINVVDPTAAQDAATKAYVDLFLKRDGTNTMTAALNLGSHLINNVTNPVSAQDAATKFYVDALSSSVSANFLKLDGSNPMAAILNMNSFKISNLADPTLAQDAATKFYTDTFFLKLDGTNPMAGVLNMASHRISNVTDPSVAQDVATKAYVDNPSNKTQLFTIYTNNTGSTLTPGQIVVASQSSSNEVVLANNSSLTTSECVVGVVFENILTGQSGRIQTAGKATVSPGGFTIGHRVYVTSTPGNGSTNVPTGTGVTVFTVGTAVSSTEVELDPVFDNVNDNVYNEYISVISGIPSNTYQIQGPVTIGTTITLPNDSRNGGSSRSYVVGQGLMDVSLNGQYLTVGDDWSEAGLSGSQSTTIIINVALNIGDRLSFEIELRGTAVIIGGGGGEANTASNLGSGRQVFKQKAGVDLQFRSLIAGAGLTITQNANDLTIAATGATASNVTTRVADYSPTGANDVILVNCTAQPVNILLPAASTVTGKIFQIKKIDATSNTLIIDGNGSETIDGMLTASTTTQYVSYTIVSDGSNWWIL